MASYGWLDPWVLQSPDLVDCRATTLEAAVLAAISHISRGTSILGYTYLPQPSSSPCCYDISHNHAHDHIQNFTGIFKALVNQILDLYNISIPRPTGSCFSSSAATHYRNIEADIEGTSYPNNTGYELTTTCLPVPRRTDQLASCGSVACVSLYPKICQASMGAHTDGSFGTTTAKTAKKLIVK